MDDRTVCLVGVARTPVGSFLGGLSAVPAPLLGAACIREALTRAALDAALVEQVYMGCVLQCGVGQDPTKQAARAAGIPDAAVCTTVNKVCASGMKAIICAAQAIALGDCEIAVAGGMESMSRAPHYQRLREGVRTGDVTLQDHAQIDGLTDAYTGQAMGIFGEDCAESFGISRADQDNYAIESGRRAQQAAADGTFAREIVAVEVRTDKVSAVVNADEVPKKFNPTKIPTLRPAFKADGKITAATAASLADGAAAVVLTSRAAALRHGLTVLAVLAGYGEASQEPALFTTTPALAAPIALSRAGVAKEDVAKWEINEAFACVAIANMRILGLTPDKVNVHGGAVALGHPLGCSGARIVIALLSALAADAPGSVGVAAVCNGGGGASALVLRKN